MNNIAKYLLLGMLVLGFIIWIVGFATGSWDPMIYFSYVLLGVVGVVALAGAGLAVAAHPKSIKTTAISVGAFAVIVLIGFMLSSDEVKSFYATGTTPGEARLSDLGLYTAYIMSGLTLVAVLYSSVIRLFK
ncbi:MAG: hypothetical protein AAGB22_03630 [Bacteroidota bacterium]